MKNFTILFSMLCLASFAGQAQFTYKIKADSVKITNDSCTAELILENHTKNVNGFLYNRGNGRTEFRKGMVQFHDSLWISGSDTLNIGSTGLFWKLKGNAGTNPTTDFLGTLDSNKLVFKTFNRQRASIWGNGIVNIGLNDSATRPPFRFYPNGDFVSNARNNYNDSSSLYKNGIRYHGRLGYLEIGTSNFIDTTISEALGMYQTSALILNTDSPNHLNGPVQNSILAAYNVQLPSNKSIIYSILTGGSYFLTGNLQQVVGGGVFHTISGDVNGSLIIGNSQQILNRDNNSGWLGFKNQSAARTLGNLTSGIINTMGSVSQLTVGSYLVNRSYAATALGNSNVNFTSLPYNDFDSILASNAQNIQANYLLLSLGNSQSKNATTRSNALTVLYNGRTQVNTTGFDNNLSESDVTPKAALEIVSKNSGILIPRLTTGQRDSIASGDRHNGLLLYNTSTSKFQYYNGTYWKTIPDTNMVNIDSTLKYQNGALGVKVDTVLSYFTRNYKSNYADIHEEFWNGVNELGTDFSGTGASVAGTATTEANHPGLLQLATGTQTNGRASVMSYFSPVYMGSGQYYYETEVNIPTLSASTQRFQLVCGLFASYTTLTQTSGVFFLYDEGGVSTGSTAASYWQTCTGNGGTRTYNTSLTQTTVATGWAKLRIYLDYVSNQASFYVNGTLVSTHTANLPSSTDMNFGIALFKSVGTTSRTIKADYISFQRHFATSR